MPQRTLVLVRVRTHARPWAIIADLEDLLGNIERRKSIIRDELNEVLRNLPESFESLGARYDNAALLRRAGVQVAITTGETYKAFNIRQEAGNAVAYGLPYEEALRP